MPNTCTRLMAGALATASVMTLNATTASAHPHGYLVSLGDSHGGGHHENMLQINFDWMMAHTMHMPMFGLPGLSEDMLSFEEIIADPNDPHYHDGIIPIAEGTKIQAVFTRFDAGVSVYDPFDLSLQLNTPGVTFLIGTGGSDFNRKIIWNLDPSAPGFNAAAGVWTAEFYIRDTSGLHDDSQVYTMSLKMVPTPGALSLLAGAGLLARQRRSSW